MIEPPPLIKINTKKNPVVEVIFAGEYLVGSGLEGVWKREVMGGVTSTKLSEELVHCLAVSKDGKRVAGGTGEGKVIVWNVITHEQVASLEFSEAISEVEFSPDATHLVVAHEDHAVTVFDIGARTLVLGPLKHESDVFAVRYSPKGDRFATTTRGFIRTYDSDDGHLLNMVPEGASWRRNCNLFWSHDQLFFLSCDSRIKRVDQSGSAVEEWSLSDEEDVFVTVPHHGMFVACCAKATVSFWDLSTHTQLGLIQYPGEIHSVAFSPDDRFFSISGTIEIIVYNISRVTDSLCLRGTLRELHIHLDAAVLDAWDSDQLSMAEALLSTALLAAPRLNHHVILGSRALIRTRMGRCDDALSDAEQSIRIQPSDIGCVAKSVALSGEGGRDEACRAYDTMILHRSNWKLSSASFLLIKAVIIFMTGDHKDAISRVNDVIAATTFNSACYAVQAYMYLLLGDEQLRGGDYEGAMHSFKSALVLSQDYDKPLTFSILPLISLTTGWKFCHLKILIQQSLCEVLYATGSTREAAKSFLEVLCTLKKEGCTSEPFMGWIHDFKRRHCEELERLGDEAMNSRRYEAAIDLYSVALSLNPECSQGLFIKRSQAWIEKGSWDDALADANEAIARDSSSPGGYEAKYTALHKAKRFADAVCAFKMMLVKITESPDEEVRKRRDHYVNSSITQAKIRRVVQRTIRHSPRVLINVSTGRLQSRDEQISAFESSPVYHELLSSMTTRIDGNRIKHEVKYFFRYVMLSHRWDANEPIFQQVIHLAVDDLDASPEHDKLKTFCRIVRDAGFNWAWSDTCCINKQDHFVLQEALVTMFKWYHNSALVIVFLRGVRHPATFGELMGSTWNKRAWTLQEYVAGKVVHFYTEDWMLYLDLKIPNHKESPQIVSEMQRATGVPAEQLAGLRPGLGSIREKLRLASTRETTYIEDAAYSLLGIFSITCLPVIYGEGKSALGRLLVHILSGSGDVTILAWTGLSSNVNSCLPARITVYEQSTTTHLPRRIDTAEMERAVIMLRSSQLDLDQAVRLYNHLNGLSATWFAANRMKLPCIAFKLAPFALCQTESSCVYRSETAAFGVVDIKMRHNPSRYKNIYLVHPWLDALLGREDLRGAAFIEDDMAQPDIDDEETDDEGGEDGNGDDDGDFSPVPETCQSFPSTSVEATLRNRVTSALQLIVRLRQPFGPLFLMLAPTGRREEYRRVLSDVLVRVQIRDDVSLDEILDNARILDVL